MPSYLETARRVYSGITGKPVRALQTEVCVSEGGSAKRHTPAANPGRERDVRRPYRPPLPRGLHVIVREEKRVFRGMVSQANSGTVWVVPDGGEFGVAVPSVHVAPEGDQS